MNRIGSVRGVAAALMMFGVGTTPVRAELSWKQQQIVLQPPVGATEAVGIFEFTNRGEHPVRITEVRSGCGCTATTPDAEVIAPGKSGSIRAEFHVGSRQGRQSVSVIVFTEEPAPRQHALTLEVELQDFATLSSRLLTWRVGEEATPKPLQVRLAPGFRLVGAESTTEQFKVAPTSSEGEWVQLVVSPRDTWAKRNGTVVVRVARGEQELEIVTAVRVL